LTFCFCNGSGSYSNEAMTYICFKRLDGRIAIMSAMDGAFGATKQIYVIASLL
jgi:hypothetical protein